MKLIRGLFMMLIGMISFTVLGSTPTLEQKQKIEIVKNFNVFAAVENVQIADFTFATVKVNHEVSHSVDYKQMLLESFNTLAIITDVGWRNSRQNFKKIPYTEKLLVNYNLRFRHNFQRNIQNRILSNPLLENPSFLYTRN